MTQVAESPAQEQGQVKNLMHTLDKTGDTKVSWDPASPEEVKAARSSFDVLRKKGYLAYRADRHGDKTGVQMREFDAQAERIVMVKPIVGG